MQRRLGRQHSNLLIAQINNLHLVRIMQNCMTPFGLKSIHQLRRLSLHTSCMQECHKAAWKEHKPLCKAMQAIKANGFPKAP